MARVTLAHHPAARTPARLGRARHERLVVRIVGGDHRRVGRQHEVDARVGHQVRLHKRAREVVSLQASNDRVRVQRSTKLFTAEERAKHTGGSHDESIEEMRADGTWHSQLKTRTIIALA